MTTHVPDSARKLASYSAAAALGAFGAQQAADAAIIYTDLDPDLEAQQGSTPEINIDNAGDFEVAIITTGGNIQVRDAYDGNILTASGTYYVVGFDAGDLIGPASSEVDDGGAHLAANAGVSRFDGEQKYVGVEFLINGNTHYGWVRFNIDSTSPYHGIVYDYAYESTPDTAITAGAIPEPGSLALLAAGAGAMALRRRKAQA